MSNSKSVKELLAEFHEKFGIEGFIIKNEGKETDVEELVVWLSQAFTQLESEVEKKTIARVKSMFTKWTNEQFKVFKLDRFVLQQFANKLEALKETQ